MATLRLEDWRLYINTLHEMALIEDDLRSAAVLDDPDLHGLPNRILFERFGVNS